MSVDTQFQSSEKFIHWLDKKIDGLSAPNSDRIVLAAGVFDSALEYHKGIVTLVGQKLYSPAWALARVLYEAYISGVWIQHCATETNLKNIQNGKDLPGTVRDRVVKIEKVDQFKGGQLMHAQKSNWRLLNSFTHTGLQQILRRHKEGNVEPNFTAGEIEELLDFANAFAALTALQVASLGGHDKVAMEILGYAKANIEFSKSPAT